MGLLLASLGCGACVCSRESSSDGVGYSPKTIVTGFALDKTIAQTDMGELTKLPHAFGSTRQAEILNWIEARLRQDGLVSARQNFSALVPNPAVTGLGPMAVTVEKSGANIYGAGSLNDNAPCVIALATHTDTKQLSFTDYLGANDSGSSTVALLQQLAYLKKARALESFSCDIIGIFFDGEEAVLPNWSDGQTTHPAQIQDNTYGSRFAAAQLTSCAYLGQTARCLPDALGAPLAGKPLVGLILMDMIGSPDVQISRDANSTKQLQEIAAQAALALSQPNLYGASARAIEDDHLAFNKAKVATIDLIDFEHLDVWHRAGDDADKISYESIDLSSRLAMWIGLSLAHDPKVFLSPAE